MGTFRTNYVLGKTGKFTHTVGKKGDVVAQERRNVKKAGHLRRNQEGRGESTDVVKRCGRAHRGEYQKEYTRAALCSVQEVVRSYWD